MMAKKVNVSNVLSSLIVTAPSQPWLYSPTTHVAKLPSHFGQLQDAEFKELKKQMEGIGGQWKRAEQGWVFKTNPTEYVNKLKIGETVNIFQDHQFFFTPEEAFNFLIDWPEQDAILELPTRLSSSNTIKFLEPEAGEGHIIEYFVKRFGNVKPKPEIYCCESMPRNIEILESKGFTPFAHDFLSLPAKYNNYFDLIIANPPFSDNQYIKHIMKMFDVTKEGGTIFTIAPDNYNDSDDPERIEFKEWLKSVHAMEKAVPKELFRKNKAGVKTNAIWIDVLYS